MIKEEYTYKQANDIGLEFSLKLKKMNKLLKKENSHFLRKGLVGFSENRKEYEQKLQEITELYDLMNKPQVIEHIDQSAIDKISKEHQEFSKVAEQYRINVNASMEVAEIFLDMAKENASSAKREDMGYNSEANMISQKKILDNMPSVAVDSKV